MKKAVYTSAAALMMIVPAIMLAAGANAETVPAWTVMVYLDGDNDIEDFAIADLAQMTATGSSADVNVVVLADTLTGPADLLYLTGGEAQTLQEWGEVPMDEGATLTRFITTAGALYPAERTALVLWDHGGGVTGLCWDDTSGADEHITLPELRTALTEAGRTYDLLVFNACMMAQAEIAFQVQGFADVLVFSEDIMSGSAYDWTEVLRDLETDPTMDGMALGLLMAANYAEQMQDYDGSLWTMSVCDTSMVQAVADAFKAAAAAQLGALDLYANELRECRNKAEEVENYDPVDVIEYMSLVASNEDIEDETVRSTAAAVVAAVEQAIVYDWELKWVEDLNGLGVFFPRKSLMDSWDAFGDEYSALPFCEYTGWDEFLRAYYASG